MILVMQQEAFSTFVRGADLTFSVSGNNVTFNIILYEESSGTTFDTLEISYGDGNTGYLGRINTITQGGIKYSNYEGNYVYPGNGTYSINVCDLVNRTSGITNINNSINTPLSLVAELTLSSFNIFSSSPLFSNDHFNKTISGDTVFHNSGTYDPDGDSLSFELINCLGDMCTSLSVPTEYTYPSTFGGSEDIDTGGVLSYSVPISNACFSFAIKVSKWRNGNLLCVAMRDILLENYWVGIGERESNLFNLTLYPNPTVNHINISFIGQEIFNIGKICLYTLDGKLICTNDVIVKPGRNNVVFELNTIPSGMYILEIFSGGLYAKSKLIIN